MIIYKTKLTNQVKEFQKEYNKSTIITLSLSIFIFNNLTIVNTEMYFVQQQELIELLSNGITSLKWSELLAE